MHLEEKSILKNTGSMFVFYIAKIMFPFVVLPYLTRILTPEKYGVVAYVKTVMTYMQIIVDFGFTLSATKDIVQTKNQKKELEYVVGNTLIAKLVLSAIGFCILVVICAVLPILRKNVIFTFLSYIVVFLSVFLIDFLFRGLEIMHVITIRFVSMKLISTALTFLCVKSDKDLLLIPIFDIAGSMIAVILVFYYIKKLGIKARFSDIKRVLLLIKESFTYFLSSAATTSFNAISTIIIGIKISSAEVAYWSVCMQVITAIQAMYNPITDAIYPEMIKTKDLKLIYKVLRIVSPFLVVGCISAYFLSDFGMMILGGKKYLVAVPVFRLLLPVLFLGFLSAIFGWPALGAIGKTTETTFTTVFSVITHIFLLISLIVIDKFTLRNIAIVRTITELMMVSLRYYYCKKYQSLFTYK